MLSGQFFDGLSSISQRVRLYQSQGKLFIQNERGQKILVVPAHQVQLLQLNSPKGKVVLGLTHLPDARLFVDINEFKKIQSHLETYGLKKKTRFSTSTTTLLVLFVLSSLIVWGLLTQASKLAGPIAKIIPVKWERYLADYVVEESGFYGKVCINEPGTKALKKIITELSQHAKFNGPIDIEVVKDETVNAYAYPGYRIIINSTLLNAIPSQNALIGVIAHELGHLYHRHVLAGLIQSLGFSFISELILGNLGDVTILKVSQLLVKLSFSQDMEKEADQFAIDLLDAANISSDGLKMFLAQIEKQKAGALFSFHDFLSTHPPTTARIKMMRDAQSSTRLNLLSQKEWQNLKMICSQQ